MSSRLLVRTVTALIVLSVGSAVQAQRIVGQDVVIENVTLISPERTAPLLHADVVLRGGRIVEIGINLASGPQARRIDGSGRFLIPGLIDSHVHVGHSAALGFALYFWNRPKPGFVRNYCLIYCAVALMSAVGMWYIPYLRGAPEKQKREYASMYAGTRHVLPARGDNPRPNLFHVGVHALFVVNFCLALVLRFQRA